MRIACVCVIGIGLLLPACTTDQIYVSGVQSRAGGMGKYACPWRVSSSTTRASVLAHATQAMVARHEWPSTPNWHDQIVGRRNVLPRRPVSTYSIVARDPQTGELGVAVQSHWFSVGSVVPWAEAGVGAVATQSLVDPAYGPLGLDLMRAGRKAPDALHGLVASDPGREVRQVAMIDAAGRVAAHTGARCIDAAGHVVNAELQFSAQANLMADDGVPEAMALAYANHKGDLTDRLTAALEAAQRAGGDIRGKQSAALLVVSGKPTGKSWADRRFDLRVEDHPEPVRELKRLVRLQRAYLHMNAGDEAMEHNDFTKANDEYTAAEQLAPQIVEIPFWRAVTLVSSGRIDEALPIFARVFEREPVWRELVPRLVKSGLLPDDQEILQRIVKLESPP